MDDQEDVYSQQDDDLQEEEDMYREPTTWKEVEESERKLAFRMSVVKEREATVVQEVVASDKFVDPLGLWDEAHEENRKRRWHIAALAKSTAKDGCINPARENFNAGLLLTTVHSDRSYTELKDGHQNLRRTVEDQNENLKRLIKDNLDRFISCKDTIDDEYVKEARFFKGAACDNLEKTFEDLQGETDKVFKPILSRKAKADSIKNALGVLNKFQFLFCLPADMNENMEKGDYKRVVHDYQKAKFFMTAYNVPVFKSALSSVEIVVDKVRALLLARLEDSKYSEFHEEYIGHLYVLDVKEDPAWFYILKREKQALTLIDEIYGEHVNPPTLAVPTILKPPTSPPSTSQISQVSAASGGSRRPSEALPVQPEQQQDSPDQNQKGQLWSKCVKKLCAALLRAVPELWRWSQTILPGGRFSKALENRIKPEFRKDAQAQREREVSRMLSTVVTSLCEKLHNSIENLVSNNHSNLWFSALLDVNKCAGVLSDSRLPYSALSIFQDFCSRACEEYVHETSDKICKEISLMHAKEDWHVDDRSPSTTKPTKSKSNGILLRHHRGALLSTATTATSKKRGAAVESTDGGGVGGPDPSTFIVTKLPSAFKKMVLDTLRDLKQIVGVNEAMIHDVQYFVSNSIKCFADCLHHLAFNAPNAPGQPRSSSIYRKDKSNSAEFDDLLEPEISNPSEFEYIQDVRLLTVLSNILHTRVTIVPQLETQFLKMFVFENSNDENCENCENNLAVEGIDVDQFREDFEMSTNLFDDLALLTRNAFVRNVSFSLSENVKRGVMLGGVDWANHIEPNEVRTYVLDLLLSLVTMHGLVHRISRESVPTIFSQILVALSDTFLDYCGMLETVNHNGVLQIELEIEFIEKVFEKFSTSRSEHVFGSVIQRLDDVATQCDRMTMSSAARKRLKEEILESVKSKTRTEFACFQ